MLKHHIVAKENQFTLFCIEGVLLLFQSFIFIFIAQLRIFGFFTLRLKLLQLCLALREKRFTEFFTGIIQSMAVALNGVAFFTKFSELPCHFNSQGFELLFHSFSLHICGHFQTKD